jgi:hypothetical protein
MNENWVEKRKYIRHPSDIPIEVSSHQALPEEKKILSNISSGGLCFKSDIPFKNGTTVSVKISSLRPVFEAKGRVVWCRQKDEGNFDVGVEFMGEEDAFRARMVEQACRIEQYKKEAFQKEGRELTGSQAAAEWIKKYAKDFSGE